MKHRKTRKTFEIHFATYMIWDLSYEQWRERAMSGKADLDTRLRWVHSPDRSPNCPSHRANKKTLATQRVWYFERLVNNKPDDFTEDYWRQYMHKLFTRTW